MAIQAKRCCAASGCPNLVTSGRCPSHKQPDRSERAQQWHRLYDGRWKKYSKAFLFAHPICADPFQIHGKYGAPARCVDHIKPHRGHMGLFWDARNHQPLCISCNSRKSDNE